MKADAALAVLAEGRRLIWTDDDEIAAARTLFPELAAAEQDGRALLIAPRSNRGLRPDHLDAIEAFADVPEQAASRPPASRRPAARRLLRVGLRLQNLHRLRPGPQPKE